MNAFMNYLDGNAAAGELSRIFATDVTSAETQCASCGAKRPFAEAHLYMQCPGLVARCGLCGHVLLRCANVHGRVFLDLRGMTYLSVEAAQQQEASN
jgi:Family of unknown function (DUF6510)